MATIILTRQTLLSTSSRRGSISFTSASFKRVCKLLLPLLGPWRSRHGATRRTRRHGAKMTVVRICWNKRLRVLVILVALTGLLSTEYLAIHAGYISLSILQRFRRLYHDDLSLPIIKVGAVDCSRLFNDDPVELSRADVYHKTVTRVAATDGDIESMARDCDNFRRRRQYIMTPVTIEEAEFPIAFSILMYTNAEQVERLLRAIYRPQNIYCIHVDRKSPPHVLNAMRAIANCFPNVFIASRSVNVRWGYYSVLEPELICLSDLWEFGSWKYFINLSGMEFPLKTNGDLVKILKAYNGSNELEGKTVKRQNPTDKARSKYVHIPGKGSTTILKSPPPHGISIVKGGVQVTLSRAFVDFVLHDQMALDFREWIQDAAHPDEMFFSSLNYNPHLAAPGAYLGDPDKKEPYMLSRLTIWTWDPKRQCRGTFRHAVCVFGVRDLAFLKDRPELFVNKFLPDFQPLAYDCMEERHFRRMRDEYTGDRLFNSSYYANMPFAKNHV